MRLRKGLQRLSVRARLLLRRWRRGAGHTSPSGTPSQIQVAPYDPRVLRIRLQRERLPDYAWEELIGRIASIAKIGIQVRVTQGQEGTAPEALWIEEWSGGGRPVWRVGYFEETRKCVVGRPLTDEPLTQILKHMQLIEIVTLLYLTIGSIHIDMVLQVRHRQRYR